MSRGINNFGRDCECAQVNVEISRSLQSRQDPLEIPQCFFHICNNAAGWSGRGRALMCTCLRMGTRARRHGAMGHQSIRAWRHEGVRAPERVCVYA